MVQNRQRAFLTLLLLLTLGLLSATLYLWQRTGQVDELLFLRLLLVAAGISIIVRIGARPRAQIVGDFCAKCGGRLFETLRSFDRRRVLTCFACGTETIGTEGRGKPESVRPA